MIDRKFDYELAGFAFFALIAVLFFLATIGLVAAPASAANITGTSLSKGVILNPTESLAQYTPDMVIETQKMTKIKPTYIVLDSIKIHMEPTKKMTVLITKWEPSKYNEEGKTFFGYKTLGGGARYKATIGNLQPNTNYTVSKDGELLDTYTTDDTGTLNFTAELGSEHSFSIAKGSAQPQLPPPPPEEGVPGFTAPIAALGLLLALLILKKREIGREE